MKLSDQDERRGKERRMKGKETRNGGWMNRNERR